MKTKSLTIEISFKNKQKTKKALLTGFAFIESGFLSGKISSMTKDFTKSEQVLITAFTFTGCPIAARVKNVSLNPWLLTNGSYESIRELNSSMFSVNSRLKSVGQDDKINMNLELICKGQLPDLLSIKFPFQENIYQINKGVLEGKFDITFDCGNNEELTAQAISEYKLGIDNDVSPVWRNIIILNSSESSSLNQIEQIDLFGNKEQAETDLKEKLSVI